MNDRSFSTSNEEHRVSTRVGDLIGHGGGDRIVDIRATTVTVPLQAPLRHSNGTHWGRFVRTIVEVETADGVVGLGEMGGGGAGAEGRARRGDIQVIWKKYRGPGDVKIGEETLAL